jgi:hypothetical protein
MDNVFVIGDVHGNLDRLEALLKQEGLLIWCKWCEGTGMFNGEDINLDCRVCKGIGWCRDRFAKDRDGVTIVQLGDLADFGNTKRCSPTSDLLCYKYVTENRWCDVVLWGNHDRAMIDNGHAFNGFEPNYEAGHYVNMLFQAGRMMLAMDAHGFLLTHAGLASGFKQQKVPDELKTDLTKFVDWLNDEDEKWLETGECDRQVQAIRDACGRKRGGGSPIGGVLWRDIGEGLYDGFRQIFGHSADHEDHQVRMCSKNQTVRLDPADSSAEKFAEIVGVAAAANMKPSYCLDIGGKPKSDPNSNCLAGIWLPSEKIVRVDL